jgi:lipopolysaccharide/colanic/teichoic acid biosynthesis glycosyltransferase
VLRPANRRYLLEKRALDVTICLLLLVFVVPLLLLCILAIRLDTPGPALFTQDRTGRDGRRFRMLKLRTMVANAEELKPALAHLNVLPPPDFKILDDPRITRVGRFLRATSLDELPQLWNVLVGEMSLVGPRPPLPHEVERYEEDVNRRLLTKPGITGLWQVSGRSNLSWEESVKIDLYYVENWSITGDLVILLKTVRAVIGSTGAY